MKFCPECGTELPVGTINFCSTCGTRLWQKESKPDTLPMNQNELSQSQQSGPTIYIQGLRLEDMVEQLLKKKGFETSKREKLRGRSGASHEIDVLAKKTNQTLAVECKNYGEARIIGIKEIRDFHSKLQDLSDINHALFVTNIKFASSVEDYASHYGIDLWDGEKLRNDFYMLSLGRLDPSVDEIVIDSVLPIVIDYEKAVKLSLVNPEVS